MSGEYPIGERLDFYVSDHNWSKAGSRVLAIKKIEVITARKTKSETYYGFDSSIPGEMYRWVNANDCTTHYDYDPDMQNGDEYPRTTMGLTEHLTMGLDASAGDMGLR